MNQKSIEERLAALEAVIFGKAPSSEGGPDAEDGLVTKVNNIQQQLKRAAEELVDYGDDEISDDDQDD